jgi:outer membrane protein assembly factor BamB
MSKRHSLIPTFTGVLAMLICGCGGGDPDNYNIKGKVRLAASDGAWHPDAPDPGLPGVTINLTGAATLTTTVNSTGNFGFSGLQSGTYTVTPTRAGYSFNPPSTSITFQRDSTESDFKAHPTNRVKWVFPTGGTLRTLGAPIYYSSPAIGSDGTIYVANGALFQQLNVEQGLYAIHPDGSRKWYFAGPDGTGVGDGTGFLSSPVLGPDGTIYAQDDKSWVYSINPDGTLKWRFMTQFGGGSTPAVGADGTIYAGADRLYALNPDGTVRWTGPSEPSQFHNSGPAISPDGAIYVGGSSYSGGFLRAMNPDGTTKWTYRMKSPGRVDGATFTFSSPAIGADGTIYLGAETADTGFVYAMNPDGTLKWRYDTSNVVRSSPAIGSDGTIYIGTKGFLGTRTATSVDAEFLALNPDGTLKWTFSVGTATTGADIYCSPAVGADGMIYFGAETGFLYALTPDGTLAWKYMIGGINWTSPALLEDGTLYIGGNDGILFAMSTQSKGLARSPWPKAHHDNRNSGKF